MTYKEQLDKLVQILLQSSQPWFKAGEALAILAVTVKAELEKKTGKPVPLDLDPTVAIQTAYNTGVIHTQAAANLCVLIGKMVTTLESIEPPVIVPPIIPPIIPPTTFPSVYGMKIPQDLPAGAKELVAYIGFSGPYWTGQTVPSELPTAKTKGTFYGYNKGVIDTSTGHGGTLWAMRWFNAFGTVEDMIVYKVGDYIKGAEGHMLYLNCVPHLNVMIRRCKGFLLAGQGVQREWRNHETALPVEMWGKGGGTFTVEDCEFYETGLIDGTTGGQSPRGSWCLSLYGTLQHTFIHRVTHVNREAPAPHEGSLFVGYGQSHYRTPTLDVDGCVFYTQFSDRADIMLQGIDNAVVKNTQLLGPDPYVDVSQDCKKVVISNLANDCLVREKLASDIHREPVKVHQYKKGTTLELNF